MNILLTNDDGIKSQGIFALYQELSKIARVTVVAPDKQRSSTGHAITLDRSICIRELNLKNKFKGYGVSGTPADCVKYALHVLFRRKPDLIVSGINLGSNDGVSVFYSGTVAAAREGFFYNIPAIAISLNTFKDPDYLNAAVFCSEIAKKILIKNKSFNNIFLNINVPNLPLKKIKGVRVTHQGIEAFKTIFLKKEYKNKKKFYEISCESRIKAKDDKSDTAALLKGYISITPISIDTTSYSCIRKIKKWSFS